MARLDAKRLMRTALVLATATSALLAARAAGAGAVVSPGGTRPRVVVETALVTWEPSTLVQHLLLSARFEEASGPFVWWLPLPGPVGVHRVDTDLRATFPTLIAGYQRRTPDWELPLDPAGVQRSWLSFGGHGGVDIDVIELPAAGGEAAWLRGQGLEADLALRDWLERYAGTGHRLVTVGVNPKGRVVTTPYIHLSFRTDRPWFPYREPAYPPDPKQVSPRPRLLRTVVIAPECVAWQLGDSLPTMAYAWLSHEPTFGELNAAFGDSMTQQLGFKRGQRYWLTSFEDYNEVRPGNDDVSFSHLLSIPPEGSPGTVTDATGAGLRLTPVAPPGAQAGPSEHDAPAEGDDPGAAGPRRTRKRAWWTSQRGRTGIVFGAMVALALVVSGLVSARGSRERGRA